ncbi:MAG TPA: response regulator transcription factor [Urbifossiella sp.]|jgi:two-component system OmpR family response regulator
MQHILVVEDEEHLAIGIKYNLEAEGYLVTAIGEGPKALALFQEAPEAIDLIILDLMLPGMSGYAVCEAIRNAGHSVPILMLSARTLVEDRIRGFDAGTDLYLQKPFDLEELMSIVRNLLARKNRGAAATASETKPIDPVYRFGRAVVNFDTYQVTVADKPLRLTSLEMKLLRYFVEHEGSVVTRAELLEEVWGMSQTTTTRTIDNFIVNLRKYFEIDPAQPKHFLSVRGTGYRFVASGEE